MNSSSRSEFLRRYWPGMALLLASYFLLTAFRDYRDNYMIDVLESHGYSYHEYGSVVSRMEMLVAVVVLVSMASLSLCRDNRHGVRAVLAVMIGGLALVGCSTVAYRAGSITGLPWMTLLGMESYLAYVPYNSLLFDRIFASTRYLGTAVFTIYVADATGYCGSVLVQIGKDLAWQQASREGYLTNLAMIVSGVASTALVLAAYYFDRRAKVDAPVSSDETTFAKQAVPEAR